MARNDVAPEFFAERDCPLKIDLAPFLPCAERGVGQGLIGNVDAKKRALAIGFVYLD